MLDAAWTGSPIGLGTMTFGAETDEGEAHHILDTFAEFLILSPSTAAGWSTPPMSTPVG